MCLIIYKPHNEAVFTEDLMRNSVSRNSDSAGYMYVEEGRVKVAHLVSDSEDELVKFSMEGLQKKSVIIHHRLATSGGVNYDNCHPFWVLNKDWGDSIDLAMVHNGVLSFGTLPLQSDTNIFVTDYLRPLLKDNPSLLYNEAFSGLITNAIGSSKLVFLDSDENVFIINEDKGSWHKVAADQDDSTKCWLSNTHSIAAHVKHTPYVYRGHRNHFADADDYYTTMYGSLMTSSPLVTTTTPAKKDACTLVVDKNDTTTQNFFDPAIATTQEVVDYIQEEELHLLDAQDLVREMSLYTTANVLITLGRRARNLSSRNASLMTQVANQRTTLRGLMDKRNRKRLAK